MAQRILDKCGMNDALLLVIRRAVRGAILEVITPSSFLSLADRMVVG